ncbi:DUF6414 family protein [Pantoea ananatis]
MAQDSQSTDSLYDYLYIDRERINALTAQLFASGVLTQVKQSQSETDNGANQIEFKIPIFKTGISANESISRGQERLFDSSWSLPLNLLDKLSESGRLDRKIDKAKLGDLVLVKGMMKIFDADMVHQFMPVFKKLKTSEAKNEKNNNKKAFLRQEINEFQNVEDMVNFLPRSTQIDFADSEGNQIWMSVKPENLTIGMGDIALKYGPFIPGEWYILGFIDAYADDRLDHPDAPYPSNINDLKSGMDNMLMLIKTMMGRPNNSFGMTPLMIFRTVA